MRWLLSAFAGCQCCWPLSNRPVQPRAVGMHAKWPQGGPHSMSFVPGVPPG
jgi:hypothetical protein